MRRVKFKRSTGILGVFLALGLLAQAHAAARKLYPVDEGPRDRSFLAFRNKLIAAARKRDRRFIYRIVAPDIEFSFGGERGRRAFIKSWNAQPAGELERELLAVLSLGGKWQDRQTFVAPYIYARAEEIGGDVETAVIPGRNVKLRARPSPSAPVLGMLSYDVVQVDHARSMPPDTHHPAWVRITLTNGQSGYVAGRYIRSAIDYRAYFAKRRGQWQMTVFIAGD